MYCRYELCTIPRLTVNVLVIIRKMVNYVKVLLSVMCCMFMYIHHIYHIAYC